MPAILITGGHNGNGLECVKRLASNTNPNIVLAGRSLDAMKEVADQLRQDHGTKVSILQLDTSSLASLTRLAADPAYADGSGKYFQVNDGSFNEVRSAAMSYDEGRAAKQWNDSRELVGLEPEEESSLLR